MLPAEIDQLLHRFAASAERLDASTWRAVVPAEHGRSYRLFIHLGAEFARAELSPYMPLPAEPARAAALMRELLRRNRTLFEARFALDDDDEVIIETVVDPADGIQALLAALDALCIAAEAHFSQLQSL